MNFCYCTISIHMITPLFWKTNDTFIGSLEPSNYVEVVDVFLLLGQAIRA